MLVHPIGTSRSMALSLFLSREIEKKYLHNSKWGSIPRYPSYSAMKAAMC